ncbi:PREDICTED: uncharacterized protein LOC109462518 [Branchiostoma belcheri]|uniref:Uncharacterized protein LOC109462518 n=1 Tax=Branchiostoma belcheri TaxID=7741 RepID=A0A6P4Y7A0_BRABE|nr:PREDICTED: uncharacterized protein LOC109462518 [Branchiostoma belcheri]
MQKGSEEEKAPLLGDKRDPESDGVVREEGATAEIKVEDEIETTDGAEGSDDVDSKVGKKLKQKLHRKKKKKEKELQEVPEVTISNPEHEPRPTIEDLQQAVQEAEDIMRDNIQKLLNNRDRKLENVLERAERLLDVADNFAKVARRAKIKMWLRSKRRTICICTTVVLVVIAGVIATVVVLISNGIIKIKT